MNKILLFLLTLASLWFTGMGEVRAQEPPVPGTEIINIALLSYTHSDGETRFELESNEVIVQVTELPDFEFFPEYTIRRFRGSEVSFTHFIRNEGNTSLDLDVRVFNRNDDDFDLQGLQWMDDTGANALSFSNDTLRQQLSIGPGQEVPLTFSGIISEFEERVTQVAVMDLIATDLKNARVINLKDSVTILVGALVDIQKDQSGIGEQLRQGDEFSYTIAGKNIGDMSALPRPIQLDGRSEEKVILVDSLPKNLNFVRFTDWDNGNPVYHVVGDGEFEFKSTPPQDLAMVDVIAVLFDSLEVGESFDIGFDVAVKENASGDIINVAELTYVDPEGSVTSAAASNEVVTILPDLGAVINYFTDNSFDQETGTSTIGQPLFLQARAAACNEQRSVIERAIINISSEKTGDLETFTSTETGPNTGIFRLDREVPTRNGDEFEVIQGNIILETVERDVIVAELICDGLNNAGGGGEPVRINAEVIVDPFGVVFDSETNELIPGTEIRIYDVDGVHNGGLADGLAYVYEPDGRTLTSNIQQSGTAGKYRFPFLLPGRYRLEVIPPDGYEFSSQLRPGQLPSDRVVDSLGSYGEIFVIEGEPTGLDFDIPLDATVQGVLIAEKEVDRKVADIGDYVNYTVNIRSAAVNTLNDIRLDDKLPFGFEYLTGTARLDGTPINDPVGGVGPDLSFELGDIQPGQTLKLSYRVYIGPGADRSSGINTAQVISDGAITRLSNNAQVRIEVRGGVFDDNGIIVGRVFLDCDENNKKDPSEMGIPGVRLYLENGNYVITDANGMYTMYAINPNKHVMKIDNYSLPEGSKLKVLDNRHAFDPSSRFVDVKKGEMHRADFAVCECSDEVVQQVLQRKEIMNKDADAGLGTMLKQNFMAEDNFMANGNRIQAAGTIGDTRAPEFKQKKGSASPETTVETDSDSLSSEDVFDVVRLLESAPESTAFLNVQDGDTLRSDKFSFWIRSRNSALVDLLVNGERVPDKQIGQQSVFPEKAIQVWEYVSVPMQGGLNTIEVLEADPFGNIRAQEQISIFAPGAIDKVSLEILDNAVSADGVSRARVQITITDRNGVRISSRMPLTLDVDLGQWMAVDQNQGTPGTQTFIEEGTAIYELQSPIEPGVSTIMAAVGDIVGKAELEFLPDLRPMIAAGILEGTLRLRDPLNIGQAVAEDGFERELTQLSYDFNNFTADGRFAFFLKGKVSGKTLLTAGYDSEKDAEERLFRDIRPEEFYPVYGESSVKGFDAQSSGRLYVRLDRGRTYALYGDFLTNDHSPDIQLGGYVRAQNGLKTHLEEDRYQVEAFGVSSVSARRVREFRAEGISRYELPDNDLIEQSEVIEIITYDREQPEVIVSIERMTRFTDYVIDPFTGVLTFRRPIFSVNENFDLVFIRATYDVESNNERYLIGGVSGNAEVAKGLQIGGGVIQDQNPEQTFTLATGNLSYEIGDNTKVIGEFAHTNNEGLGQGQAGRVEVQHKGKNYEVLAQAGRSGEKFDNPGASLGQARSEGRARSRVRITESTNLTGEFLFSRNDTTGDQTVGALVNVQQNFKKVRAEVGLRYSDQSSATAGNVTNTNLRSKLTAELPVVTGASAFGEFEQDINEADRRMIAMGGDYKIKSLARAYARHEFISSAGGRFTMQSNAQRNNTIIGIDANYMKNGQVFSEYRLNDALDGRSGQASIGLRNRFMLREGLGLNTGFERIFTVQGPNNNDGTAVSTSVDYTANPNWKGTARAEARLGVNQDTYMNSLGYGLRINHDWTFLGRNIIALSSQNGAAGIQRIQQRLQLGAAFRDLGTNNFDALMRYEFKFEKDENIAPEFYRSAHVFSGHANIHPSDRLVFSTRLAAKYSLSRDDLTRNTSFLELISGRMIYDLNERWDAGINASLLANADLTTRDYGLGLEVGYIFATNLRLATGFNFFGYEDEDLVQNNYTRRGAYLGFSYKFDEQVFRSLVPNRAATMLDESLYLTCVPCAIPVAKGIPVSRPDFELKPAELIAPVLEFEALQRFVLLPGQVHFDNDMSYITPFTAQMLDKVAKYLLNQDDYIIDLTGFADRKATIDYNIALSRRRSEAVRAYLVAAGVRPEKLYMDYVGESESKGVDLIEMARDRKVDFAMKRLDDRVQFTDQLEDLQINRRSAKVGNWDYLFQTRHNAVPLNLNLTTNGASLSRINQYLLARVAVALVNYPEVSVRVQLPADDRFNDLQQSVMDALLAHDADINRFMFVRGNSGDNQSIRFSYLNTDHLEVFEQNDDVKFAGRGDVYKLMDDLLKILKSREDYELIHDTSQSYVVPDRISFAPEISIMDHVNQAVMSRIGSYLRNNPSVTLELSGNGGSVDRKRLQVMRDYLTDWGIESNRLYLSPQVRNTGDNYIHIRYRNADSINIRNMEMLNRYPK